LDQVMTAFAGQTDVIVSEAKSSKGFEDRKSDYRPRSGGSSDRRSSGGSGGGYRGGDRGGDRGASSRPAASAGGDKPWRNRELSDRSSRPSGGSDRRSSGGSSSGSGYKKRY
jgi:ATP-dependent RNA helicase DeaD